MMLQLNSKRALNCKWLYVKKQTLQVCERKTVVYPPLSLGDGASVVVGDVSSGEEDQVLYTSPQWDGSNWGCELLNLIWEAAAVIYLLLWLISIKKTTLW